MKRKRNESLVLHSCRKVNVYIGQVLEIYLPHWENESVFTPFPIMSGHHNDHLDVSGVGRKKSIIIFKLIF